MAIKQSAGILLFRNPKSNLEVFLVHPGGPFWKNKDDNVWSIPKGEFTDEDPLEAAKREFLEETGIIIEGIFIELGSIKLKSGKIVFGWAMENDIDAETIVSNNFEMEWPPHSGVKKSFPEVDKGGWFDIETAEEKINLMQIAFLDRLQSRLNDSSSTSVKKNSLIKCSSLQYYLTTPG